MTHDNERISGEVCTIAETFEVQVATPQDSFLTTFTPERADHGSWTWHHVARGETNDASGTYTIAAPSADGTRRVSMTGTNTITSATGTRSAAMPYTFDLVPALWIPCPV